MNSSLLAGQFEMKNDCSSSPSESQGMCFVGLDAMQRANSTLEDFVSSPHMFCITECYMVYFVCPNVASLLGFSVHFLDRAYVIQSS